MLVKSYSSSKQYSITSPEIETKRNVYLLFRAIFPVHARQVIVNVVEESKRPERDLPRSVYISFALVITLFCLTNMAYFSLLSFTETTGTDAVAVVRVDILQLVAAPIFPAIMTLAQKDFEISTVSVFFLKLAEK